MNRQARLGNLICKYNNYETAHRVFRREIWHGQTETQLLHSRGEPARKSSLPMTPERQEWIYGPRIANRCHLRVMLENGVEMTAIGNPSDEPCEMRIRQTGVCAYSTDFADCAVNT